jgi:hypothetical protein
MFHAKIESADVINAGAGHDKLTRDVADAETLSKNLESVGISLELVQEITMSLLMLRKEDFAEASSEQAYAGGLLDGLVMGIRMDRAARERVLGAVE